MGRRNESMVWRGWKKKENALVMNRAQKVKTWSELELGGARLNDSADNSNIYILGTNVVRRRYHRDVDICESAQ